jgi:uncharacterized protein YbbC (DUF1343 family)
MITACVNNTDAWVYWATALMSGLAIGLGIGTMLR